MAADTRGHERTVAGSPLMMDGLQFNPISLIQSVGWTVCLQNSSVPVRERVIVLVALRRSSSGGRVYAILLIEDVVANIPRACAAPVHLSVELRRVGILRLQVLDELLSILLALLRLDLTLLPDGIRNRPRRCCLAVHLVLPISIDPCHVLRIGS